MNLPRSKKRIFQYITEAVEERNLFSKQRVRLFLVSLIVLVGMSLILTMTLYRQTKIEYQNEIKLRAADYQSDLEGLLIESTNQIVQIIESMIAIGRTLDDVNVGVDVGVDVDVDDAERLFTLERLKEVLSNNWIDLQFIWNINRIQIVDSDAQGKIELNFQIDNSEDGIGLDLTEMSRLAEQARFEPSFVIQCEERCILYRAAPMLFPDGNVAIIILSSSLVDVFIDFSRNNDIDAGIIKNAGIKTAYTKTAGMKADDTNRAEKPNPVSAEVLSQDAELLFSNDYAFSRMILERLTTGTAPLREINRDNRLVRSATIHLEDSYQVAFIFPLKFISSSNDSYEVFVVRDLTERFLRIEALIYDNLLLSAVVIVLSCMALAAVFGVGVSRRFRLMETALESQMKIVDKKVMLCTVGPDGTISSISHALKGHPLYYDKTVTDVTDIFKEAAHNLEYISEVRQSLSGHANWDKEVLFTDAKGNEHHISIQLNDLRQEYKHIDQQTLLFEDITGDKIIERYSEKLRSVDRLRRELISQVSHDLRTPLTSLQGYLETWRISHGDLTEEESVGMIQTAEKNATQLNRLIDQLFELAQLEDDHVSLKTEVLAIAEVIFDVMQSFDLKAKQQGVDLTLTPMDSGILVIADPVKIESVFTNLIGNAIRHCKSGAHVIIKLSTNDTHRVFIEVEDSGIGIDEAELPNIFNPYYQAANSVRKKVKSSGLGLAITQRIVTLHGSEISVTSTLGEGSCFSFSLEKAFL